MNGQSYSADEAAERLGVSKATLYAYVSRGLIHSEATGGSKRTRRYSADDVDRLLEKRARSTAVAEQALQWGAPLLDSALTLIEDGQVYYRGHSVVDLAQTASLEEVAGLLWMEDLETDLFGEAFVLSDRLRGVLQRVADLRAVERMQGALIVATGEDASAYDLRPQAVMRTGVRIVRLMTCGAIGAPIEDGEIARVLQRVWVPDRPAAARLLNAALVLCADHELNVSAFTARCVASAGSTPYAAVIGGLSALQGIKHGGYTERVEALLREVRTPDLAGAVLGARLRRGEQIPGFGHPLYPAGDPRGSLLLAMVEEFAAETNAVALAKAVVEAAADLLGQRPTLDFGLAALAHALALPSGAALGLFALGRAVGWIGHAIEQYESDQLIRPRARYVGRPPLGTE